MFPKNAHPAAKAGMIDALRLFAGKHVQNNCSETINSILDRTISLQGCRSIEKLARRIRTFFIIQNNHDQIHVKEYTSKHRSTLILNKRFGMKTKNLLKKMKVSIYRND
jgi:hypothetical protein